jgi:hypothetical protein
MCLREIWRTRNRYPSVVPVAVIHDEVLLECNAEDAKGVAQWAVACLLAGSRAYIQTATVAVDDPLIAESWAKPSVVLPDEDEDEDDDRGVGCQKGSCSGLVHRRGRVSGTGPIREENRSCHDHLGKAPSQRPAPMRQEPVR